MQWSLWEPRLEPCTPSSLSSRLKVNGQLFLFCALLCSQWQEKRRGAEKWGEEEEERGQAGKDGTVCYLRLPAALVSVLLGSGLYPLCLSEWVVCVNGAQRVFSGSRGFLIPVACPSLPQVGMAVPWEEDTLDSQWASLEIQKGKGAHLSLLLSAMHV